MLMPAIRAKQLERCQMFVDGLKSAPAERVIIFSEKKTWAINPVRHRRNNRYLSKHPASVMSLDSVASNGAVMPLIWFPSGYRLTGKDYEVKLAAKLDPWISNTFDKSSVTVVLQRDGAPAGRHTHPIECNISCNSKIFPSDRKHVAAILASRQITGLRLLTAY